LTDFKKRLDEFQLNEAFTNGLIQCISEPSTNGESELMFVSFPSSFCTDNGRAIGNAGSPLINKPSKEAQA